VSRRRVLGAAAAAAAVAAVTGPALTAETARAASRTLGTAGVPGRDLLYIGSWTANGLYAAWFDREQGTVELIGSVCDIQANWTTMHPVLPVIYVAGNDLAGSVSAYRIDSATGALTAAGSAVPTDSSNTQSGGLAYIGVDAPSGTLLAANYAAGIAATLPIARDGRLGAPVSEIQDSGSGPNARQSGPHVHDMTVAPGGQYMLTPDFGADKVFIRRFDRATRQLSADEVPGPGYYAVTPGDAPRRIEFHPGGRVAYLLSELGANIRTLSWDPRTATLTQLQDQSIDTAGFTGTPSAAELALSADGRFVYVSNRGQNSLLTYSADSRTGLLTLAQRTDCGGDNPWSISIHPDGRWMFVANRLSNTVNLFSINQASGTLTNTGTSITVPLADGVTVASAGV
jgi:6-phosphogluconolactonase